MTLSVSIKKHPWLILSWGTVILFALLYLSLIFNDNLLTDEAFTMQLISGSVPEILAGTAGDVHPPLYYLFAKLVYTLFGRGIPPQKVLSIIPMVLTLALGPTRISKSWGERAGFWYTLFLACVPCSMEFALQVRMYSLAVLCVTEAFLAADELNLAQKTGKAPGGALIARYLLWSLAACYTHYYALVSVGFLHLLLGISLILGKRRADRSEAISGTDGAADIPLTAHGEEPSSPDKLSEAYLQNDGAEEGSQAANGEEPPSPDKLSEAYLQTDGAEEGSQADRKAPQSLDKPAEVSLQPARAGGLPSLRLWLGLSLALLLGYAPWGFILLRQTMLVSQSYWIPPITLETVGNYFVWMFALEAYPITLPVYIALLLLAALGLKLYPGEKGPFAWALLVPFLTMLFGIGYSLAIRPIYRDQYIFPCMGLIAVFFALGMRGLKFPVPAGFKDPMAVVIPCLIAGFLLFSGAVQYKENFHAEYRSSRVPELEAYFAKELMPQDCIVYNFEVFDFIYEYYFPDNDLIYIRDYNPDNDYAYTYFLDTPHEWEFTYDQLVEWDYTMAYVGEMGVEQNDFTVYRLWKNR